MSQPTDTLLSPADVLRILQQQPRRWVIPTVVMTVAAIVFALVKPASWEASQALIVRQEAAGSEYAGGKFTDVTEMKTVQETILELAKSKDVLEAALVEIGPPAAHKPGALWPTDRDIASLRGRLKIIPSGGAEFGTTEVFYLKITTGDRQRAVKLVGEVCDQLETRYQTLRDAKAQSMVDELTRSVALADENLATDTARLAKFERQVGADLAELRMLHALPSGSSDIRQKLVAMEGELRGYETERRRNEQLLDLLDDANQDPTKIIASPDSLLTSQPALRRLKDGLVDAQLATARLLGSMTTEHPSVKAARQAEQEIRGHFHNELPVAIEGVKVDLRLNTDRVETLRRQLGTGRDRLVRLAGMRAEYTNLLATTENRTAMLETARGKLADAQARQVVAHSASLIARIGAPDGGVAPVGLSKAAIAMFGMVTGLMTGFGMVFLSTNPQVVPSDAKARGPLKVPVAAPAKADRPKITPASKMTTSPKIAPSSKITPAPTFTPSSTISPSLSSLLSGEALNN